MTSPREEQALSTEQAHALLDILSHHEVYAEIRDFRSPDALDQYGPPFTYQAGTLSTSPSLQALVAKFILKLPGFRDVSEEFWQQRCATIVKDLQKAELSESYDKGLIGIRKTLATAVSALIEYPVRGIFSGFRKPNAEDAKRQYNISNPEDLETAFSDLMNQSIYGTVIDEVFAKAVETDKLSEHSSLIQAAHEFIVVNLASFMHYTLILSPKGQQLLSLIDHANKLIPYTIIKQTLKIGNVASMLNAMMKVVLAKMSMTSVTNWIGLTKNEDDGMNLLQHVIAQTLQWDIRDLKSKASKIEKDKEGPKKEQLEAVREYLRKTREQHESMRERSEVESKSIVYIILSDASTSTKLTESQHRQTQEYLATHLAIRDREQIIKVFCKSQPDHLTQGVRDCVSAYEPVIRSVHDAVDLSDTVSDLEKFISDMIKLSKLPDQRGRTSSKPPTPTPTVGDFVQLIKKHQAASHKFIHQCAKNGPEVTGWFHEYALHAVSQFRRPDSSDPSIIAGAGALTQPLNDLFNKLPSSKRTKLLTILDARALYLSKLHAASAARLRAVVTSPHSNHPALTSATSRASSRANSRAASPVPGTTANSAAAGAAAVAMSNPGPGAYLARWQELMDWTLITPSVAQGGHVRSGGKGSVLRASRAGVAPEGDGAPQAVMGNDGATEEDQEHEEDVFEDAREKLDELGLKESDKVPAPDVRPVVEALAEPFRRLLAERGCTW